MVTEDELMDECGLTHCALRVLKMGFRIASDRRLQRCLVDTAVR
jgi:hypothetical protein